MKKMAMVTLGAVFSLALAIPASAATYELTYSTPLSQTQTSTIMFDGYYFFTYLFGDTRK